MKVSPPSALVSRAAAHAKPARWRWLLLLLAAWAVAAYLVAPWLWKKYFQHHPQFADAPRITHTADGHPGDPLNIALVGAEPDLIRAMRAADWFPADPITLDSSLRIAVDSVFRRPDDDAPVSNLYLFGRKQDLAFEQPVGESPRQRHHVRFWRWDKLEHGRPVWVGSATFDERVGLSYTTGQVTHHIGPDVDQERDRIMTELKKAGWARQSLYVAGFHEPCEGRNGGGDPWHTDGRLGTVLLQTSRVAANTRTLATAGVDVVWRWHVQKVRLSQNSSMQTILPSRSDLPRKSKLTGTKNRKLKPEPKTGTEREGDPV